ncbi:MAG TPA: VWA domain-containing protein [Edaphobacter sp.]|jgi:VWFA-related protein|nr:VWA domain-containing protein [Edaphobacter sp.]
MLYRSAAITLLTSALFAQSSQPDSKSSAITTLKANTQLVIVDVTVTDAHRKPVHNLKASDFVVLEDNVSQNIKAFEEHAPISEPAMPIQRTPLPPGVFTNLSPVPQKETLNVLLLDTLNTPLQDQAFVRAQIKQYLKNAPGGARIAIFGLATRLYLLQGFTSDPEILRAAVDHKSSSKASPLLDDPVGGGNGAVPLSQQYDDSFGNLGIGGVAQTIAELQQFEAEQQSSQLQFRAKYTLDSLNQLARYLSGLQGRKNLIWFSGSFPVNILPDGSLNRPFAVAASSEDEFRQTINLLARSQVAVYPVDARGLMTSPTLNASNTPISSFARNPMAFGRVQVKFYNQIADEHSTMLRMAEQTGGHAYINTNGLSQAVSDVIENGANYYTIAYSPANTKWDGRYRKIQVRVPQNDFTLTYRRGYFGDDPQASYRGSAAMQPINSFDPVRVAMMHGAPDPTQIIFQVRVVPASAATEDTLAAGTAAGPDSSKIKPPYRRYNVIFAADPRHIRFTQSVEGNYVGQIQFVTYVYDQDGQLITRAGNEVHANLPQAGYVALFRGGLHCVQQISVPDKGNYYFRIGVYDMDGDHAGAVEFPVAAVRNLPPQSVGGSQSGNARQ